MNVLALDISLGPLRAGLLFQYGTGSTALTRFIPDEAFWSNPASPVFSWAATDDDAQRREIFWRSYVNTPFFNAEGGRLPAFFRTCCPKGRCAATSSNCAAAGPTTISTCWPPAAPICRAMSTPTRRTSMPRRWPAWSPSTMTRWRCPSPPTLCPTRPRCPACSPSWRWCSSKAAMWRAPAMREGTHIIAKLPTAEFALLPEVEELSLRLAQAAGVDVCEAWLAPMDEIVAGQPFVLGESRHFLAVKRFDRGPQGTSTAKTLRRSCASSPKKNTPIRPPATPPWPGRCAKA
jgi:serine/threonine-protein kinase HipA